MSAIQVYNTLSRQKEPISEREQGKIGMYACGPTVYNYIHIGNARTFMAFDMIRRYLEYRGYRVTFVQNITDVDDKIIKRAVQDGCTADEVARKFTDAFQEDMAGLGVMPPTDAPRATEMIPRMIAMIKSLIEREHAYFAEGDVFFAVTSLSRYGKLSGRSLDEMRAGERVEVDPRKRHPMDFVLWKAAKPGEPFWESPWGRGRPGWHIECSAMSLHHLGEAFDIHGGAQDLIFPHHENEIAQSEGALGEGMFAQQWLHAGLLQIDREKMSKSVGNIALLRDLLKEWPSAVIRILMLKTHYRQSLEFSDAALAEAREALRRFEEVLFTVGQIRRKRGLAEESNPEFLAGGKDADIEVAAAASSVEAGFVEAMDDDFNTAEALALLFDLVKRTNVYISNESASTARAEFFDNLGVVADLLAHLLGVLGVTLEPFNRVLSPQGTETLVSLCERLGVVAPGRGAESPADELLEGLLSLRESARQGKDWGRADLIRDGLKEVGIAIEDTDFGPQWKPA